MGVFRLAVARFRWKLYKFFQRLTLGRVAGWGCDTNMIYSLRMEMIDESVRRHVEEATVLAPAMVEDFSFPEDFPPDFIRTAAVPTRHLYRVRNVAVSVETGAMWIPGEKVLVESLGNNIHFYAWGGLIDVMRRPLRMGMADPVVPCANLGYYHWLLDAMAQVLLARERVGSRVVVVVSSAARRYVREGLRYFGIPDDRVVFCDGPIEVSEAVLVARNPDLAVIPRDNLRVLRDAVSRRVADPQRTDRKIYVSRRLERNRAILNEADVETLVRRFGFEVCYFERMSIEEQMQTMAEASVVMGVHGAGLSNIIAGRKDLKVVELINPKWFNACFAHLARQLGFDYRYLVLAQRETGLAADLEGVESLLRAL